eukprot:GEMP01000048.1.p1 GENE.GEMP01000048.1~~GEMP01000048.1.p1  ORF type:complete len:3361 (+),score=619.04 GEMP01000048.1:133-10215(+)
MSGRYVRVPRKDRIIMTLYDTKPPKKLEIKPNWLKDANLTPDEYRRAVKQALMIGAAMLEIERLKEIFPDEEQIEAELAPLRKKLGDIQNGVAPVMPNLRSLHGNADLTGADKRKRDRGLLIKHGARPIGFHSKKKRDFAIAGGFLETFGHGINGIPKKKYSLKDLKADDFSKEEKSALHKDFEPDYQHRIIISLEGRGEPVKLYSSDPANDPQEIGTWYTAIKICRQGHNLEHLVTSCVKRMLSLQQYKGWTSLKLRHEDIVMTNDLMRQFTIKLLRSNLAPGWNKWKALYHKALVDRQVEEKNKHWGLNALAERAADLQEAPVQETWEIREKVISQIQTRFHQWRMRKISEVDYQMGKSVVSRTQQMRRGYNLLVKFQSEITDRIFKLCTSEKTYAAFVQNQSFFQNRTMCYSEDTAELAHSQVYSSDSLNVLNVTPFDPSQRVNHLEKTEFSTFVRLDNISGIILNSERSDGLVTMIDTAVASLTPDALQQHLSSISEGPSFTILGPKVAWSMRVHDLGDAKDATKQRKMEVIGKDTFEQITSAEGFPTDLKWLKVGIICGKTTLAGVKEEEKLEGGTTTKGDEENKPTTRTRTHVVVHIFGKRFESEEVVGDPIVNKYNAQRFVAVAPVGTENGHLKNYDREIVSIDVIKTVYGDDEDPISRKIVLATRPTLFTLAGEVPLQNELERGVVKPKLVTLQLHRTDKPAPKLGGAAQASMEIEVTIDYIPLLGNARSSVEDASLLRSARYISPEAWSVGPTCAMYTSLKGTWYNPGDGLSKFQGENVAQVAQFDLHFLKFPSSGDPANDRCERFFVEMSCAGVRAISQAFVRPKGSWLKVASDARDEITFNNNRIFLQLPPTFWDADKDRSVAVVVYKTAATINKEMNYKEFSKILGVDAAGEKKESTMEKVYTVDIVLAGLRVDEVQKDVHLSLNRNATEKKTLKIVDKTWHQMNDQAVLACDISLRDRDFVRTAFGFTDIDGCSIERNHTICIGDKATVLVEQPQMYPANEREYRRRYLLGKFEAKKVGTMPPAYSMPLRDPLLMHEYTASGLKEADPKFKFNQTFIPDYCRDVAPHRFVLPLTEAEFNKKRCPGVYWRLMDEVSKLSKQEKHPIVKELTHLVGPIAATVVSMSPDCTVDLDITEFVKSWSKTPDSEKTVYSLPGKAVVGRDIDKVSGGTKHRYFLKGVPLTNIRSVQTSGINIYDANATSTETSGHYSSHFSRRYHVKNPELEQQGGYKFTAGPLPMDSNPSVCQYEWMINCHAKSEEMMLNFIATLRACLREDHAKQVQKMKDLLERRGYGGIQAKPIMPGGQVEIVLVECRRLQAEKPKGFLATQAKVIGQNLSQGIIMRPVNPFATFTLRKRKPGEDSKGIVVSFKGLKEQRSSVIQANEHPKWCDESELEESGGWAFSTGKLDVSKKSDFAYNAEISIYDMGLAGKSFLSSITFDIDERHFMDPHQPFNNMWFPMEQGEIHLRAQYKPVDRSILSYSAPSVVKYFHYLCESRPTPIREPITDAQANLGPYDPNLSICNTKPVIVKEVRDASNKVEKAEEVTKPARSITRPITLDKYRNNRIVELVDSEYYNRCVEVRQRLQLDKLRNSMHQSNRELPFGDMLKTYVGLQDEPTIEQIGQLFREGIPPELRVEIWLEITHATKLKEGADPGLPRKQYDALVRIGENHRACITTEQLLEDYSAFHNEALSEISHVEMMAVFEKRLQSARHVGTALITFSQHPGGTGKAEPSAPYYSSFGDGLPVSYAEGLLVIAYHMLLTQHNSFGVEVSIPEDDVFWILYSLIGSETNGAFASYFCPPTPLERYFPDGIKAPSLGVDQVTMIGNNGVMHDICLLDSALAVIDKDTWLHLQGLGFQLYSFFHTAFIRWFAGFLPSATLFRFWDYLFFTASKFAAENPSALKVIKGGEFPHGRHALINLSMAVMRKHKKDLLHCTNAMQIHDTLRAVFNNMWDPGELMHMTHHLEVELWGHWVTKVQIVKIFQDRIEELGKFYGRIGHVANKVWSVEYQNKILGKLLHDLDFEVRDSPFGDGRPVKLDIDVLRNTFIPTFQKMFPPEQHALDQKFGGMHRPMATNAIPYGYLSDLKIIEHWTKYVKAKQTAWWHTLWEPSDVNPPPYPEPIPPPPNSRSETLSITRATFMQAFANKFPRWSGEVAILFDQFAEVSANTENIRISTQELLAAIIICTKGTVSARALELFQLFGFNDRDSSLSPLQHVRPESNHAREVIKMIDGSQHESRNLSARLPVDMKDSEYAVQFIVKSDMHKSGETVAVGVIGFLGSFIASSENATVAAAIIPLWSEPILQRTTAHVFGTTEETTVREERGELHARVKWIPSNKGGLLTEGRLDVMVEMLVLKEPDARDERKNPYINIKLADPNSPVFAIPKTLTFVAGRVASQEKLLDGSGQKAGYFSEPQPSGSWRWGQSGKIITPKPITLKQDFVQTTSRENVIDLRAVRLIVRMIAQRCMLPMTLRQATLFADHSFSRNGKCAGIEEAFLCTESAETVDQGFKKDGLTWRDTITKQDVRREIILEWERQVNVHYGDLDLWPNCEWNDNQSEGEVGWVKKPRSSVGSQKSKTSADTKGSTGKPGTEALQWEKGVDSTTKFYATSIKIVEDLQIKPTFGRVEQTLVIRYVTSITGDRKLIIIPIDKNGCFGKPIGRDPNSRSFLALDPLKDDLTTPHMQIKREEYLTCFLQNTVLSESLRQITSCMEKAYTQPKEIQLQVHLANPRGFNSSDEDFLSFIDVGQSVLLEVWDSDRHLGQEEFIGECWLPSLNEFAPLGKSKTLHLHELFEGEGTDRNDLVGATKRKPTPIEGVKRGGMLEVYATWTFPFGVAETDTKKLASMSAQSRLENDRKGQTGRLVLTVRKAENLPNFDFKRSGLEMLGMTGAADPFVQIWIRNDLTREWYPAIGKHKNSTSVVKQNLNPVWEQEFKIDITSAQFEVAYGTMRSEGYKIPFMSRTVKQQNEDEVIYFGGLPKFEKQTTMDHSTTSTSSQYNVAVSTGTSDVSAERAWRQENEHGVRINMSDTILDFKVKINAAIAELKPKRASLQPYPKLGMKHHVLVFVPPENVLQLDLDVKKEKIGLMNATTERLKGAAPLVNTKKQQYRLAYERALADATNYQPLDPMRTFKHYEKLYGFGQLDAAPVVRVVEATRSYERKNPNFLKFVRDRHKSKFTIEHTEGDKTFAFVRKKHADYSEEWQPVHVREVLKDTQQKVGASPSKQYTIEWECYVPDRLQPKPKRVVSADDIFFPISQKAVNPLKLLSISLEKQKKIEWDDKVNKVREDTNNEKQLQAFLDYVKKVQAEPGSAASGAQINMQTVKEYLNAIDIETKRKEREVKGR